MNRDELVCILDEFLDVRGVADRSDNGMQVEGREAVRRVGTAVDCSIGVIEQAVQAEIDLLVVHHGLFWGRAERVVGAHRARLKALLEGGISVYAAHLPLDLHPEVGNNVELLRLLELVPEGAFGRVEGISIGFWARCDPPRVRESMARRLEESLGSRVEIHPFGPEQVQSLAVVSGSGGSCIEEAIREGLDCIVLGEWTYASYHTARENGLNVLAAGHYATETVGVRALGQKLADEYGLEQVFLPEPTDK